MSASKKTLMSGWQIANLQGLRGAAALLVVLYHLQPAPPVVAAIFAVAASVAAAVAIHKWVEVPILQAARRVTGRHRSTRLPAALAMQSAE